MPMVSRCVLGGKRALRAERAVEGAYEVHGAIHCISIADGRIGRLSDGVTVALLSLRINYNVPDVAKLFSRFGPLAHARLTATAPLCNHNRSLSGAHGGGPGHYLQLATQVSQYPAAL